MRGMWRRLALLGMLGLCAAWLQTPMAIEAVGRMSGKLIVIDIRQMSLTLYENGEAVKRYPVAAGTADTPSPLGVFRITRKFTTEPSGFGTRFMGIDAPWGIYGIHGTNKPGSIGHNASHGCIRMFNKDVEELYRLTPIGTPVIIENSPYGELGEALRTLRPDDRGNHVKAVQRKLRALGYYEGGLDGIYGQGMRAALRRFKEDAGLPMSDVVDGATYAALGLLLFE